jgi:hypothetical protein
MVAGRPQQQYRTRLTGEEIAGPVVVSSGDVIGIGRIALKVELE